MNIIGISAFYHDSAAVLLQDGEIHSALQEERFTRKKHDPSFPENSLKHLFQSCPLEEVDYIAYYEKPLLKFERIIDTFLSVAPKGLRPFKESIPSWAPEKLFLPRTLKKKLQKCSEIKGLRAPLVFPSHHESHAASAFFPSPFQDAAIITLDGVGEWSTLSYGQGSGHSLSLNAEQRFPHSLGLLYSAFTTYCGFRVNSGEYKLMGLAPYGEPKYAETIKDHLIQIHPDGSFHLDLSYFGFLTSMHMVNEKLERLFGRPRRKPDSGAIEVFHMDIAASIQAVTEEVIIKLATHVRSETGQENLCLAGGVSLNCVANGQLHRAGIFKNIWVQPAAGDAGGALGAALFTEHQLLERPRKHLQTQARDGMKSSLLGTSYSDKRIHEAILNFTPVGELPYSAPEDITAEVARLISEEQVVARFSGRMEYGPRALGNRSILGDPRSPELQKVMNQKIKFREDFRPFAPICLAESAVDYFTPPHDSPYMLMVSEILEKHRKAPENASAEGLEKLKQIRSTLPAITHVNHSARLQTVTAESNPSVHALLHAFRDLTGCPMLINTSFNVRGEPIVETPKDAIGCFLATDIDALAIGPYLLQKKDIPPEFLLPREDYLSNFHLD